jgi:polyhydroxybutyrate depolymerase
MQEIYNDIVEQKNTASMITKKMLTFMKDAEDMSVIGPVIKEQQKILNDCTEKKMALPVMIVNGTDDKVNPYEGGEVITNNISLGFVRSTDRTFAYLSSIAGYKGKPKMQNLPDTDPKDGKTIEKYTFKKKRKPEVTLLKVINGKHDYPNDIDVHLEAWEFFKRSMK